MKGFMHPHLLTILFFILVLIGGWFVYHSYTEQRLTENLLVILNDYQKAVFSVVSDKTDREKVDNAFKTIEETVEKYKKK